MFARFARSRLAGFRCPSCEADLPYRPTRVLIFATVEERKNADEYCVSCGRFFRVQQPNKSARLQAHRRFAVGSVGFILLGLVMSGLLVGVFPNLSGVVAFTFGIGIGLCPLPFVEAWATRSMTDFRKIKRRKPPLASLDAT